MLRSDSGHADIRSLASLGESVVARVEVLALLFTDCVS